MRNRLHTSASRFPIVLACLLANLLVVGFARAQSVSDLPRSEYYVARELLGAGAVLTAQEGFQAAFERGRRVGEVRWVDSIPPMVMLGECYYQQGNISAAMEQYDAALMLVIANPTWVDELDFVVDQLPTLEFGSGLNWFGRVTPPSLLAVPEAIQIAIDPLQAQQGPQGGIVAPISLVTRLDAAEVFYALAIALSRRAELLGPLAEYSPLAAPIDDYFTGSPRQQAPWVQQSWQILRGLAQLPRRGQLPEAIRNLREGSVVVGRHYHYLSSMALQKLAEIEMREGKYPSALDSLQTANLLAAQFVQHLALAQSACELAVCSIAANRADIGDALQALSAWSAKRSTITHVATLAGLARLHAHAGLLPQAEKSLKQAASVLQNREVILPRYAASVAFTRALTAFQDNQTSVGQASLAEALKAMQGSAQTGAVVPEVFQAQMVLNLLAGGGLSKTDATTILTRLMAEPLVSDWETRPLETLARITTSSTPAYEHLLDLAVEQQVVASEVFIHIDRLQRQRLFESLPLGGRLACLRMAFHTEPQQLSEPNRAFVRLLDASRPQIRATVNELQAATAELRRFQIPLDDRKLTSNAKKQFSQTSALVTLLENQLRAVAVMNVPFYRSLPLENSLEATQAAMRDDDLLIAFAVTPRQIHGMAIRKNDVHMWQLGVNDNREKQLVVMLTQMGLWKGAGRPPPVEVVAAGAPWRKAASEFSAQLYSDKSRQWIAESKRLIIVPHRSLWYVPFELLPSAKDVDSLPLLAEHPVCYLPLVSSFAYAQSNYVPAASSLAVLDSFFSLNRDSNQMMAQAVVTRHRNTSVIQLDQKITAHSAAWLRLTADRVWIAAPVVASGWDSVLMTLGRTKQESLAAWLETPHRVPTQVIVPGFATALQSGQLGSGDELFVSACAILYSGTKTAVLSRWPVGGQSTADWMSRYLDELSREPSSSAHRRATLAVWAERYLVADEPALMPAGKSDATLVTGAHPVLWSGYMAVGDTVAP